MISLLNHTRTEIFLAIIRLSFYKALFDHSFGQPPQDPKKAVLLATIWVFQKTKDEKTSFATVRKQYPKSLFIGGLITFFLPNVFPFIILKTSLHLLLELRRQKKLKTSFDKRITEINTENESTFKNLIKKPDFQTIKKEIVVLDTTKASDNRQESPKEFQGFSSNRKASSGPDGKEELSNEQPIQTAPPAAARGFYFRQSR